MPWTDPLFATAAEAATTPYRPYLSSSALNKPIPSPTPIHPASSKMISAATKWVTGSVWMIPNRRGIYYHGDLSKLPTVPVYINYLNSKSVCATTPTIKMPMPSWFVPILKGVNNTPTGPNQDRNVVLVDTITGDVWETWHLTPPGMASLDIACDANRWNAAICNRYKADLSTVGYPASGNPSGASSTKIHYLLGLLTPEDFADCFSGADPGTAIEHAIRCSGPQASGNNDPFPLSVVPARHGDGFTPYGIPEGARFQLDPSLDVAKWPSINALREPQRSAMKKLCRGFQKYGGFLGDRSKAGGAVEACHPASVIQGTQFGAGYKFPWDKAGYGWGTVGSGVPADLMAHFRVIDWTKWTGV